MTDQEKNDLYVNYNKKVLGYIMNKVNDINIAEDLCADIFVKIYSKIDEFDSTKASISTWIYTVTRNSLIDYYRTRKVHEEIPETLTTDSSIEDDVCNNETLETLADALGKLDERERDIIIGRYYSGYSLKDLAEKIGVSYSYIKVLHNNALNNMKKLLKNKLSI